MRVKERRGPDVPVVTRFIRLIGAFATTRFYALCVQRLRSFLKPRLAKPSSLRKHFAQGTPYPKLADFGCRIYFRIRERAAGRKKSSVRNSSHRPWITSDRMAESGLPFDLHGVAVEWKLTDFNQFASHGRVKDYLELESEGLPRCFFLLHTVQNIVGD
ncbi:hypothetical protein KM043_012677 [Ampulex compressa]|nr:hypothetical protein KM043_012677 [Ampulex compressa]